MGLANCLQPLVFVAKYCYSMFLRKNDRLDEFYGLLVVDWSVCYRFVTVNGSAQGGDYGLGFCRGACL